jgi:RimJ/RimL family protein N-acetyltransferase
MLAFETERLAGRPLAPGDEALYCELYTDAETMLFIGAPLSRARALHSFSVTLRANARRPPTRLCLALVEKSTQQPVGICAIHHLDVRQRRVEAGIILRSAARARGYSKEGLGALITEVFAQLPVDEVRVQISADHLVVERLVRSLGFTQYGVAAADDERAARTLWSADRRSWAAGTTKAN